MEKNERGLLRRILEYSSAHKFLKRLLKPNSLKGNIMEQYIPELGKGKRILDLGCGTAEILKVIEGEKRYVGIDYNDNYIASASKEYQDRKTVKFVSSDLNTYAMECDEKFDIILMLGVLHHIDDQAIESVMKSVKRLLDDSGIFISLDCCYSNHMNPIARLLVSLDRGRYPRYSDDMISLMNKYWENVWYERRTDTLRLPYNVIVFKNSGLREAID